MNATNQSVNTS